MPTRRHLPLPLLCALLGGVGFIVYVTTGSAPLKACLIVGAVAFGTAAIAYGIWRYQPRPLLPWMLLGIGQLLWGVAQTFWQAQVLTTGNTPAPDELKAFFFQPSYPIVVLALILIIRRLDASVTGPLDVAILASAVFVFAWSHLLADYLSAAAIPILGEVGQIAYAVFDVLILAAVLRLLVAPGRRNAVQLLVAGSAAAWIASDFIWNWSTQLGSYSPSSWADGGWLLSPILIGAAALSPKMASAFDCGVERSRRFGLGPLLLLLVAALLGPTELVLEVEAGVIHKIELLPVIAATAGGRPSGS
jgi:two-component system cell cycle response regulator